MLKKFVIDCCREMSPRPWPGPSASRETPRKEF